MEVSNPSICVAGTFAGDIILHCKLDCGHQILLETFWKQSVWQT